jgi:CDP-ribitol ribitolphosphotransferase
MHPLVASRPDISGYHGRIIDVSDYGDIGEIFYVTDILITDYSTAYSDFAVFRRPILFYTYDRAAYEATCGCYQSVREFAPGKVCDTFDDLMSALEAHDYEIEKTMEFADKMYSHYDGTRYQTSDAIIENLLLGEAALP